MTSTCMLDDSLEPGSDDARPAAPAPPPLAFDVVHARHWRVQPIFDPRPVAPELRGVVAPGHTERPETCPVCTPGARPLAARPPERRPPPIAVTRPPEPPRRPRRALVEPSEGEGETLTPATPHGAPTGPLESPGEAPTEAPPAVRRTYGATARPASALRRDARRPPPPAGMTLAEVFGVAPPPPAPALAPPKPARPFAFFGEHLASQSNTVLLAARDIAQLSGGPVTVAALVVAVWQRAPVLFGLEGCETVHPDSNKVIVTLSRPTGPVARGYLTRTGPRTYALTERGARAALALDAGRLPDREGRTKPLARRRPATEAP